MYSNVTRDAEYISQLLGFVMREYQLEPLSITQTKRGYYGETWRLNTACGSYFLKLDYSAAHQAVYERSFPLLEHLRISGIDFISRIVKTANGEFSAEFDGAVLGVFNWIDGDNIENEQTKAAEYKMITKIYTVPYIGLNIPQEDFSTKSVDLFFNQMKILENSNQTAAEQQILRLFMQNNEKLIYRAKRLKIFSSICCLDKSNFYITHGDAGGNIIADSGKYYIIDWDDPIIAPSERDAWFCLCWDWAVNTFNNELLKNGIDYKLRPERLAYYCYNSYFFYLTEYMQTYLEIGDKYGSMVEKLKDYFSCWIENVLQYADKMF